MTREELVEAFTLERVQSAPARMDLKKLDNLNGHCMAAIPPDRFAHAARTVAAKYPWAEAVAEELFGKVAELMQSRTKLYTDIEHWAHFFLDLPEYDAKACRKFLKKPEIRSALAQLSSVFGDTAATAEAIEQAVHVSETTAGVPAGKLNQPLRVAVTGMTIGAGIYETIALMGCEKTRKRIDYALAECCPNDETS